MLSEDEHFCARVCRQGDRDVFSIIVRLPPGQPLSVIVCFDGWPDSSKF